MKVILIRSNPVNPCPRTEKMARSLIKNGHEVTVLAWDREEEYTPKENILDLNGYECRIIRIGLKGQFAGGIKKNLKSLLRFQFFIFRWLYKHRSEYSVIHAYDLDTAYVAQKAAKITKKTFIYDIADYYSNGHGYTGMLAKTTNIIENRVINRSFATIICTEERKEEIKGSHPRRLYVIHNTPDLEIKPYETEPHERFRLAYVGVFGKTRFLKEITECISKRKDCEFHIGGFGANMEQYFIEMSEKYDNIFFYGRIPYKKTIEIEQKCDVLPIIYDPSLLNHIYAAPNKFYEALALGKPMIMAKGTGMSSIVEKYGFGETIEYSIDGLQHAINRMINKKTDWVNIGARERELYETTYSWNEMNRRISQLYDEIMLYL